MVEDLPVREVACPGRGDEAEMAGALRAVHDVGHGIQTDERQQREADVRLRNAACGVGQCDGMRALKLAERHRAAGRGHCLPVEAHRGGAPLVPRYAERSRKSGVGAQRAVIRIGDTVEQTGQAVNQQSGHRSLRP